MGGPFTVTFLPSYVYCCDEAAESLAPGIDQLFGAVKSHYPEVLSSAIHPVC